MARPHRYAKRCGREYWSFGVACKVGIAPRDRGVEDAEGAPETMAVETKCHPHSLSKLIAQESIVLLKDDFFR
jgi:hypothetical protein